MHILLLKELLLLQEEVIVVDRSLPFKNNAPIIGCILKINNTIHSSIMQKTWML